MDGVKSWNSLSVVCLKMRVESVPPADYNGNWATHIFARRRGYANFEQSALILAKISEPHYRCNQAD
jgi:hypothetical protein